MTGTSLHTVMISGDTPEAFAANFAWWAEKFGYVHTSNVLPPPIAAASAAAPEPEPKSEPLGIDKQNAMFLVAGSATTPAPKRGRGRPPKALSALAKLSTDETGDLFTEAPLIIEAPPEKKPATVDDAKQAGRDLITKKGVSALREVLNEFTVDKVVDLKSEQLEGFIEKCVELAKPEQLEASV